MLGVYPSDMIILDPKIRFLYKFSRDTMNMLFELEFCPLIAREIRDRGNKHSVSAIFGHDDKCQARKNDFDGAPYFETRDSPTGRRIYGYYCNTLEFCTFILVWRLIKYWSKNL